MPTWTSNIPSQVKPYANVGAFPLTGSVKTIYIAEDTDIAYYWTGSAYQSISIQDLSGLVPYTGATTDVDLGNNDLNAEGIKIKGTAGNGHLNMKHQSSNPTAGGQETVVFAGADGEPRFKNDGNAVEQFASRQWVGLQGFITNVITALGFTPVPQTRTINGLDLSTNRTLTTANINDSTNSRYVTDAQLTVIGNTSGTNTGDQDLSGLVPNTRTVNGKALSANITLTPSDIGSPSGSGTSSGTNTGDETQSSILSKLGFINKKQFGGSVTGTTSETIVHTYAFSANELSANEILHFETQFFRVSPSANGTFRLKFNTSNTLVGSVQLATNGMGGNTSTFASVRRKLTISGGNIIGFPPTTSSASDLLSSAIATLSNSIDVTQSLWFFVTYQPSGSGDTATCSFSNLKNF